MNEPLTREQTEKMFGVGNGFAVSVWPFELQPVTAQQLLDHDAALRQQLAERDARITKLEMDTVPRSRYNACNQDWLDAEAKLKIVQASAQQEIERLTQDVIAWEHDYRELQEKLTAYVVDRKYIVIYSARKEQP